MPDSRVMLFGAAVLAALLALWGWSEVGRYQGLYKTEKDARVAAQDALAKVKRNIPKVDSKNEQLRFALDESLRLNREWSDRRTPAAVYDSLCARATCRAVQPLPSPAD